MNTNAIQPPLLHSSLLSLTPPTIYIVTSVKPFSFVWYVIPLLKTGALASTCDLCVGVDDKKNWKKPAREFPIDVNRSECLPDGGIQGLLVKPSSEVESKTILMGHPILCCHALVVRSFFFHCKVIISPQVFCFDHLTILVTIIFTQVEMGHLLPKNCLVLM